MEFKRDPEGFRKRAGRFETGNHLEGTPCAIRYACRGVIINPD